MPPSTVGRPEDRSLATALRVARAPRPAPVSSPPGSSPVPRLTAPVALTGPTGRFPTLPSVQSGSDIGSRLARGERSLPARSPTNTAASADSRHLETVRIALDWVAGDDPWHQTDLLTQTRRISEVLRERGIRVEVIRGQQVSPSRYNPRQGRATADFTLPGPAGPVTLTDLDVLDRANLIAARPGFLRALVAPTDVRRASRVARSGDARTVAIRDAVSPLSLWERVGARVRAGRFNAMTPDPHPRPLPEEEGKTSQAASSVIMPTAVIDASTSVGIQGWSVAGALPLAISADIERGDRDRTNPLAGRGEWRPAPGTPLALPLAFPAADAAPADATAAEPLAARFNDRTAGGARRASPVERRAPRPRGVIPSHREESLASAGGSSLATLGVTGGRNLVGRPVSRVETVRISLDWVAGGDPWQHPEVIERARETARALEARGVRVELVRGHAVAAHRYDASRGQPAASFSVPRPAGAVTLESLDILDQAILLTQGPGAVRALVSPMAVQDRRAMPRSASRGAPVGPLQRPTMGDLTVGPALTYALPDAALDDGSSPDVSEPTTGQRHPARAGGRRPVGRPERVQVVLDWVAGQDPWRPGHFPSVQPEVERRLARQGVRLEFVRGREVPAAVYEETRDHASGALTLTGPRGAISLEAIGFLADAVPVARRPGQLQIIVGEPARALIPTRSAPLPLASIPDAGPIGTAEAASVDRPRPSSGIGAVWTSSRRSSHATVSGSASIGRPPVDRPSGREGIWRGIPGFGSWQETVASPPRPLAHRFTPAPVAPAGTYAMAQRVLQRFSGVTPGRGDQWATEEDLDVRRNVAAPRAHGPIGWALAGPGSVETTEERGAVAAPTPLNILVFDVPRSEPGPAPTLATSPPAAIRPTVGSTITRIDGGHGAPPASAVRPASPAPSFVFARDDASRELPLRRRDVARAEEGHAPVIQRASGDATTAAAANSGPATAEGSKPPDLDQLARQVYAMLKQRLAVERERLGRPRGLRTW